MHKSFEYLPKDKRKKIVVICDDIRVHSGIATVGNVAITHTTSNNHVRLVFDGKN